jgi:hypothetical protein
LMERDGWDRAKSRATLSSIPGSQSMRMDFMLRFLLVTRQSTIKFQDLS